MKTNKANAVWNGSLKNGKGHMILGENDIEFPFSFSSRFEDGKGSNPEILIGAAHAGCFSMEFSNLLSVEGHEPKSVSTTAKIFMDKVEGRFTITESQLIVEAVVPGIENDLFQKLAMDAKENCPVSKALSSLKITLNARLME